ncbi:MAG TPA: heparinase [Geobacter sp.]|nr:heparinase [Geobacter sp.]
MVARRLLPLGIAPVSPEVLLGLALPVFRPEGSPAEVQGILSGERFTLNTDRYTLRQWEAELSGRGGAGGAGTPDIRAVWEPARLQHVTLLLAYLSGREEGENLPAVREFARQELLGWLDANPFLQGPHYRSAMECALRIPVFFYAMKLLDNLSPAESTRVGEAAYAHALWVEANLSLHSSRGNHTVCEAAGLVFGGAMFRDAERGRHWLARGIALLGEELVRQVLDDGGALEQSLSYHRFVLDLYWLTADFLEGSGLHDCGRWRSRLRKGEAFLGAFSSPGGRLPALGDSDDGHAVAPGLAPAREALPLPKSGCRAFPAAGYTVFAAAGGMRLTFDHGPLGMPPLNNHGHADALSLTLSLAGNDLLVDPGTYRYNGEPSWRSYFKGTAAHNTVTIDGLDQAVQETGFIWSNPYGCRVLRREEAPHGYLVEAEHDGYRRLTDPVLHRRAVVLAARDALVVRDSFTGAGEHHFDLHFHLHPEAAVTRDGECWHVQRGGSRIWLRLLGEGDLELLHGGESSPLGWYSPAYGSKVPSKLLRCRKSGACRSTSFGTAIGWGDAPDISWMEALGGAL